MKISTKDNIVNFFKQYKLLLFFIILGLPFILIPVVVVILRIGIFIGSLLPAFLIILQINMSETVTLSTFIYYYTCFLAIEITGIFSYLVWETTKKATNINTKQFELTMLLNKKQDKIEAQQN